MKSPVSTYLIVGCATFFAVVLTLFSYTQIDLSLTLSRLSIWQQLQASFQHVGFYQRPWATALYLGILVAYFCFWLVVLLSCYRGLISRKSIWTVIGVFSAILLFSYPAAFSYDIFNYIFTAKTVALYQQNPYGVTPLQFTGIDPMLSYMRWTHLPSAYTPVWILTTIPLYILSFNSLLAFLLLLKGFAIVWYLLAAWGVEKILRTEKSTNSSVGLVLFALNPVVITEVLVSAHNDMMMMGLAVLAVFLLLRKQPVSALVALAFSIATKFMTIFLLPVVLLKGGKTMVLVCMTVALGLVLTRREFLPWYFLWVVPFLALFPERKLFLFITLGVSLGLTAGYAPLFYYGPGVEEIQTISRLLLVAFSCVGLAIGVGWEFVRKKQRVA